MEKQSDERRKPKELYPNCDMTIWLRTCEREVTAPVEGVVFKEIPDWLEGCLLRNGPGGLRVGKSEYNHLFDASALLHRFYISKGTVTYQNRYLQSETYKRNRAAQRIVVTEFGTKSVPDPCQTIFQKISAIFDRINNPSDNAMISIYPFGDEYFAMTETPIVHRINESDLSTIDSINLTKRLGVVCHTSHPHITEDKTVFNLGLIPTNTGPKYCILKFLGSQGKSVLETGLITTTIRSRWRFHPSYMHSFGMTDNYYIIVEQPLSISLYGMIKNTVRNRPLRKALKWFPNELTVFYIIERSTGKVCHRFVTEAFFYLHIINQYEENDHVVIDICCYKDPSMIDCMYVKALREGQQNLDYANMFRGRPLRFVLPLNPKKAKENLSSNLNELPGNKSEAYWLPNGQIFVKPALLCNLGCETPRIYYEKFAGKKYKFFYAISSDVDSDNPGTLIKVDVENKTRKTWCEDNVFPSEPIFVPKPSGTEEDDGVILSALIYAREKVSQVGLLILDAKEWTEIGRAVFETGGPVPKCLHGWFIKS